MTLTRRGFFGALATLAVALKLKAEEPVRRLPDLHEVMGPGYRPSIMDDRIARGGLRNQVVPYKEQKTILEALDEAWEKLEYGPPGDPAFREFVRVRDRKHREYLDHRQAEIEQTLFPDVERIRKERRLVLKRQGARPQPINSSRPWRWYADAKPEWLDDDLEEPA